MRLQTITLALLLVGGTLSAQIGLNPTGVPAAASAALDVVSTSGGFLPPRMTTAQRLAINSPAAGLLVLDSTDGELYYYADGAWIKLSIDEVDNQQLSLNNDLLSLSNSGPTVDLSGYYDADDLGNHNLVQDIDLGGKAITRDGSATFRMSTTGALGINAIGNSRSLTIRNPGSLGYNLRTLNSSGQDMLSITADGEVFVNYPPDLSGVSMFTIGNQTSTSVNALYVSNQNNAALLNVHGGTPRGSGNFAAEIYNFGGRTNNTDYYNGLQIKAGHSSFTSSERSFFIRFLNASNAYCGGIVQNGPNSIRLLDASDERLKTDIRPTRYGLRELLAIEVVDYNYRTAPAARLRTGFLAQQLHQHYPEAVDVGDEHQAWGVDYRAVTPLVVRAVQEQEEAYVNRQRTLREMETRSASLRSPATEIQTLLLRARQISLTSTTENNR